MVPRFRCGPILFCLLLLLHPAHGEPPSVTCAWNAPTTYSGGAPVPPWLVPSYNIYRGSKSDGSDAVQINVAPISSPTYVDTSIASDQVYYYAVTAFDPSTGTEGARSSFLRFATSSDEAISSPGNSDQAIQFVPIVLASAGVGDAFYTSEMTLANRSAQAAGLDFDYRAAFGEGSGTVSDVLAPGQQLIHPDSIDYLRSLGMPIPPSGDQGGTLTIRYSGLSSSNGVAVIVRTTTAVANGRCGLAYPGITRDAVLRSPSVLCGLRQNGNDRSHVAIQNAGTAADGNVTLRLTIYSGDAVMPSLATLPDQVLTPGEFRQINDILVSNGLGLDNGYVRVQPVAGTAPYYAYGVINDQVNSDGSFVPPIQENLLYGRSGLTLPAVVEIGSYSTELIVTNWSPTEKILNCQWVSPAIQTSDSTARFSLKVNPSEQLLLTDIVQRLRDSGVKGVAPRGRSFAGALFASVSSGDLGGLSLAARTTTPGAGGRFGLFYASVPNGLASAASAWIYDLQQNALNRSNLALVNTGETDRSADTFEIEIFDGGTGAKVTTIGGVTVPAKGWLQISSILTQYAPNISQGYARVSRVQGNNPFIAYAVLHDGAAQGQGTGDGAFLTGWLE
jgi:hypothetical protein